MENAVYVTLVVIIIASVGVFLAQKQGGVKAVIPGFSSTANRQSTFIICGLSNTGKTALYNELVYRKFVPTVTSQEPNSTTTFPLPSSGGGATKFKLVEFPGHHKLHGMLFDEIKKSTNIHGLIYMVDATTDPTKLTEAAKFLFEVLSFTERRPGGVDILIACNKSDLFSARQASKIKEILASEIDSYRQLSSSNVSKLNNEDGNDEDEGIELGNANKKFTFDQLDGNFDVMSGSVLRKDTQKWENWIDERAVNF